jgi:hypothetical protein
LMSSSFTTASPWNMPIGGHADLLLCAQFAYFLSSGLATRREGR